ncbi:hypothetical protein WA845_17575 [Agrobacterium sp. CMT1]|uniref:hypothetical protein n=1 Tax=Agrobacterium sp. CMT1 TaxID=3128901 RepID=UPI003076FABC
MIADIAQAGITRRVSIIAHTIETGITGITTAETGVTTENGAIGGKEGVITATARRVMASCMVA